MSAPLTEEDIQQICADVRKALVRLFPNLVVTCVCRGTVNNDPTSLEVHVSMEKPDGGGDLNFNTRVKKTDYPTLARRWILGSVIDGWSQLDLEHFLDDSPEEQALLARLQPIVEESPFLILPASTTEH